MVNGVLEQFGSTGGGGYAGKSSKVMKTPEVFDLRAKCVSGPLHTIREPATAPGASALFRHVMLVVRPTADGKVERVATGPVVAGVHDLKPRRYRSVVQTEGVPMGLDKTAVDGKMTVPVLVGGLGPFPATGRPAGPVNSGPESCLTCGVYSLRQRNRLSLAWPLRVTPRVAVFLGGA